MTSLISYTITFNYEEDYNSEDLPPPQAIYKWLGTSSVKFIPDTMKIVNGRLIIEVSYSNEFETSEDHLTENDITTLIIANANRHFKAEAQLNDSDILDLDYHVEVTPL